MILLLDSHAFLWWADDPELIAEPARVALADSRHKVFFSLASLWELAIKQGLGKLKLPGDVEAVLASAGMGLLTISARHVLTAAGLGLLTISARHVLTAGALGHIHRDPFDRLLVAQAQVEGMTVITRDPVFSRYGVSTMLA